MSKEEDEIPGIIPLSERQEELEVKVRLETARILAAGVPRVHKKYTHIEIPDFGNDRIARENWELEEIRRCIEGYYGLPGKMYYFFHHCRIKHKKRGKIRPDFRTIALEWYKFLEKTQKTQGRGIVCIKRRQIGMSWMAAVDALHDCSFNREFQIGMNSKGETDSRNLFQKVKYIHRNLPDFIKPVASAVDRRDAMDFSKIEKDEFGNKIRQGTESTIISVAPTATGHAGNQYTKLIMDEAGETELLEAIWANAEDCIMQETERVGIPIIFGTMGETDKAGKGLMEFWLNHKHYDLDQFAFWGYNGLIMDEFGNDMIEDSVRWIIYKRKKKESGSKVVYNKFIQKYPLNQADAFLSVTGLGVGDPLKIGAQEIKLLENPPEKRVGWMRPKSDGTADFVPDPNGKLIVYDIPDHNRKYGYVASVDPAEDDDVKKSRDVSDIALAIVAKPYGLEPPKLVAEFCDRPPKLEKAYEQIALALTWYNKTKVNIEMNKGGWRMKDWFELYYPHLIALSPASATSARGGVVMKVGVKKTAERTQQMMGLIDSYVDNYVEFIPSLKLLKQFKVFGADHEDDDLAVAFGWDLVVMQADKLVAKAAEKDNSNIPKFHYKKVNGVIQVINRGSPMLQKPRNSNGSVLFNR